MKGFADCPDLDGGIGHGRVPAVEERGEVPDRVEHHLVHALVEKSGEKVQASFQQPKRARLPGCAERRRRSRPRSIARSRWPWVRTREKLRFGLSQVWWVRVRVRS